MRCPRLLSVLLVAASSSGHAQEFIEAEIFTIGESYSYSEAVPVVKYLDMLIGPAPDNGTHALSRNLFEIGMKIDAFSLSFVHRNDYNLDFGRETAEFAWLNKNRQPIPHNKMYEVDVKANQYQLTGLKFGYEWDLRKDLNLYGALSYLVGTEAISGYMGEDPQGEGGFVSLYEEDVNGNMERRVSGDLHADYFYTRDVLFDRDVKAGKGYGYSIDIGFDWQIDEHWSLRGKIDDLKSEIRWDDMPHTIADATSETIQIGEDGFLVAYPLFSGIETFDNFKQKLRRRERLTAQYDLGQYFFAYEFDRMEVVAFHRLAAGYRFSENWGAKVALDVTSEALHFGLSTPVGDLQLMLDDLDPENARTLGFAWALRFPL